MARVLHRLGGPIEDAHASILSITADRNALPCEGRSQQEALTASRSELELHGWTALVSGGAQRSLDLVIQRWVVSKT